MVNQKFIFINQKGKEEIVVLENWIWGVLYKDGSQLHQFENSGVFHQIKEIDQSKVKMWTLYQPKGKGDGRIDLLIPEGKEVALIHKYKIYGDLKKNGQRDKSTEKKIYVFGYKVKGQQPHYNFVMPNGTIIQSVGDQEPKLSLML